MDGTFPSRNSSSQWWQWSTEERRREEEEDKWEETGEGAPKHAYVQDHDLVQENTSNACMLSAREPNSEGKNHHKNHHENYHENYHEIFKAY